MSAILDTLICIVLIHICINIVNESIIVAPKMQNKFGKISKLNILLMLLPINICFKFGIIFQLLFLIALRVDGEKFSFSFCYQLLEQERATIIACNSYKINKEKKPSINNENRYKKLCKEIKSDNYCH